MTRTLDERFLNVHPRTQLWWKQREQCSKCKHAVNRDPDLGTNTGRGMYCIAVPRGKRQSDISCIRMRDGRQCGPDALLFSPIEEKGAKR